MSKLSLSAQTITALSSLKQLGINPVLYGSQGASLYLGAFKDFSDIDLLIPSNYLDADWHDFMALMLQIGFEMINENEHEFRNKEGLCLNFASEQILLRDSILEDLNQIVTLSVNNLTIRTLTPKAFIRAYEHSKKDGYRKDTRGKNDQHVIDLLNAYLAG